MTRVLNRGSEWKRGKFTGRIQNQCRNSIRKFLHFKLQWMFLIRQEINNMHLKVNMECGQPELFRDRNGIWSLVSGYSMQMLLRGIGFIDPKVTRRTVEYILKEIKEKTMQ